MSEVFNRGQYCSNTSCSTPIELPHPYCMQLGRPNGAGKWKSWVGQKCLNIFAVQIPIQSSSVLHLIIVQLFLTTSIYDKKNAIRWDDSLYSRQALNAYNTLYLRCFCTLWNITSTNGSFNNKLMNKIKGNTRWILTPHSLPLWEQIEVELSPSIMYGIPLFDFFAPHLWALSTQIIPCQTEHFGVLVSFEVEQTDMRLQHIGRKVQVLRALRCRLDCTPWGT